MLDEMIEDLHRGVFSVLVVWASDRIERRGAYNAFDLARRVKEAGGRIEYVKDSYLNATNDMSDVMLALAATRDKLESQRKSERTQMVQARIRAAGAFVGKPPFGYVTSGQKYARQLVPTDEGRRLIPEVYARIIAGDSLAKVGAWLEEETGKGWWPRYVSGVLRNPVYRGVQEDDQGRPIHRCEPLVDAAIWRRTNEALGRHGKRGPENKLNPALLSGVLLCGNPNCVSAPDSPMYRHRSSARNKGREWYRCAGRGTQRKGCGNMIRLITLDRIVNSLLRQNELPYKELRIIPGTDYAAEIEEVKFEIRSVMASDLTDDEIDIRVKELRAERDRLQALPVIPDRLEYVTTGETYGHIWASLSPGERGPWLRKRGYKVRATKERVVILDSGGAEVFEYISQHRQQVPEGTW